MTAIRQPGKVNADTTLIDVEMMGVPGVTAIYLIEGEKKCLIDGGTSTEARRIIKELEKLNALPPEIIIITHPHWDHTQAVPRLRKKAERLGKQIEVLAGKTAIPYLTDQSWNSVFGPLGARNVEDVKPLAEGDVVDLGGINLRIFEVPGHCEGHLAIFDEKNKNIFVGDSLGYKTTDELFIPPFMPPFWNAEAFLQSIAKLKKIDYETLCLAHFGYIFDSESKDILDESVSVYKKWWQLFEDNLDKLDDLQQMAEIITNNISPKSDTEQFGSALIENVVTWLITGFKMTKKI